jgi:hypothetical protein
VKREKKKEKQKDNAESLRIAEKNMRRGQPEMAVPLQP